MATANGKGLGKQDLEILALELSSVMPPPARPLEEDEVAINADFIPEIRRMLTIGLHAFGEVNRVRDQMDVCKERGLAFTHDMRPVTIGSYEVAKFADALLYLEGLEART